MMDFDQWWYEWLAQRQAAGKPQADNAARAAWHAALTITQPEALSAEPTELQVQAGAVILATTPLIDAPKLGHCEWMGLSRQILEAASLVNSPHMRGEEP